ncbi:hypothetical protein OD91_1975 [Lutibacter sp. Hel_I_33_5]|nr:hypothetical protein OD91_1975 [Lutibacter sp. Hel_I_33_5]
MNLGRLIFNYLDTVFKIIENDYTVIYRIFIDTFLVIIVISSLQYLVNKIKRQDSRYTSFLLAIILAPLFYEISFQRISCVGWFNENSVWFIPLRLHMFLMVIYFLYKKHKMFNLNNYILAIVSGFLYVITMWLI